MADFDYLSKLSDTAFSAVIETLLDEKEQETIMKFKAELTDKMQQLIVLNEQTKIFAKQYNTYLRQTYRETQGTSFRNYNKNSPIENAKKKQEQLLIKIFLLIHRILDTLSKGTTKTTEYSIYYNTPEQVGSGEFFRRTFTTRELYQAGAFSINEYGGIVIKRSTILKLHETMKQNEKDYQDFLRNNQYTTQARGYQEIANAAIERMVARFHEMDNELSGIGVEATESHLGGKRWERYKFLRDIATWSGQASALYERYMLHNVKNVDMRKASYNRGHIVEAYERFLKANPKSTIHQDSSQFKQYFEESLGNLPWYAGGDVGNTQVKSLFADSTKYNEQSVNVASIKSIVGLINELLTLLNMSSTGELQDRVKNLINDDLQRNDVEGQVIEVGKKVAAAKVLKELKKLDK